MADAERILAALGAVPAGARPKTILAGDNQEPGYYQTDTLSNLVRVLKKRQLDIQEKMKTKQEAQEKKLDMYKTLREAGYDPKSAYEAVMKGILTPPGEEDTSLKKTTREKILDKLAKGDTLTAGEQQVYDETIKHKEVIKKSQPKTEESLDDVITEKNIATETPNQKRMREQILESALDNEKKQIEQQKLNRLEQAKKEEAFQKFYADIAKANKLDPNPDDPQHFYDYRAYFNAIQEGRAQPPQYRPEHKQLRMPDEFKLPGHPDYYTNTDPETWTLEQTQKYIKEHPAQDLKEEVAFGTLLDKKKKENKLSKTQEDLNTILGNQNEEMILVIAPDGTKGKIPKSKLAAALKAGYRKR